MKKRGIIQSFLIFLILVPFTYSAESENYKIQVTDISSGSDSMSSNNYRSIIVIDHSGDTKISTGYKTGIGFTYTIYEPIASTPSETEETSTGGGGSSGGGGGGAMMPVSPKKELNFSVKKDQIVAELVLDSVTTRLIEVKNTGQKKIEGKIEIAGVENFVLLSGYDFVLDVGETKKIELNIAAKELGLFTGKIILAVEKIKEEIPIIIKVETEKVLFDTKIEIPEEKSEIAAGEELETQVTLISMGLPKKVDVFITYEIKDMNGNTVLEETETVAVEKQLTFTKSFKLSQNLQPGDYVLGMEVWYEGALAIGGELFTVVEKEITSQFRLAKTSILIILISLIIITVSTLIYNFFIIKKK